MVMSLRGRIHSRREIYSEIQRRQVTGRTSSRRMGGNRVEPIGRDNFEWCDRLLPENVGRGMKGSHRGELRHGRARS